MIDGHLFNFSIVVLIQLAFFLVHTLAVNEQKNFFRYLLKGMLLGLPFGICFDLVFGKYVGVFTYTIGFPLWILAINGLLSYGFMIANVLLLQRYSLFGTLGWSIGLGLVYEISNYFLPVWKWTFAEPMLEYFIVIAFGYFGLTGMMMFCLRMLYSVRFRLVPF